MHPNAELLHRYYAVFSALDADTMQACYARDAHFRDEVFTLAGAEQIGAMWHMLCDATQPRGRDVWRLEASGIDAHDGRGGGHWEARYRFGPGGRVVHNRIDAEFKFRDGRIVGHHDRFDFWRWSRQALGAPGWLLGWTPWLRAKVQTQAMRQLARHRPGR